MTDGPSHAWQEERCRARPGPGYGRQRHGVLVLKRCRSTGNGSDRPPSCARRVPLSSEHHARVTPLRRRAIRDSNALSVALVRGSTGDYLSWQSVTGMTSPQRLRLLSRWAFRPDRPQYARSPLAEGATSIAVIGLIIGIVLGMLIYRFRWLAPFLPVAVVAKRTHCSARGAWLEGGSRTVFVVLLLERCCCRLWCSQFLQLGVGSAMTTTVVVPGHSYLQYRIHPPTLLKA